MAKLQSKTQSQTTTEEMSLSRPLSLIMITALKVNLNQLSLKKRFISNTNHCKQPPAECTSTPTCKK